MPYNTTAIPPRREPTGQTQLPLSRVKKIIAQDPEVALCSNNAAFVITLATEMFIQHITDASLKQAKLERKPRRNIQYKDVASAVSHQDNLEFLEDIVPKTVPFKKIKVAAAATQARLRGEIAIDDRPPTSHAAPADDSDASPFANGLQQRRGADEKADDPNEQLELEMMQAAAGATRDDDTSMTG